MASQDSAQIAALTIDLVRLLRLLRRFATLSFAQSVEALHPARYGARYCAHSADARGQCSKRRATPQAHVRALETIGTRVNEPDGFKVNAWRLFSNCVLELLLVGLLGVCGGTF
jgi:hypothetical protein